MLDSSSRVEQGVRDGDGTGEGAGGDLAGGDGVSRRAGGRGRPLPHTRPARRLVVRARARGTPLRRGCRSSVDRPDRARQADGRGCAGGDRLDTGAPAASERAPRSTPLPRLRPLRAAARAPDALARPHPPLRRRGPVRAPLPALARAVQAARPGRGTHLSIDGFHAEADAALASLRASLALARAPEVEAGADAEPSAGSAPEPGGELALDEEPGGGQLGGERPVLTLAEPRSGPTPKRRSSNQTSVSRTDPQARLRGKPGQRPHLVYRGQVGSTASTA